MKTVKPLCGDFLPLSEIHWELLCAVLLIWKQLNPIMVTRSFCPHGIALLADYWRTFLQYILQPLFASIMATIYCRTPLYHKHSIYHEMLPLHVHSEVWVCKLRHKKKPYVGVLRKGCSWTIAPSWMNAQSREWWSVKTYCGQQSWVLSCEWLPSEWFPRRPNVSFNNGSGVSSAEAIIWTSDCFFSKKVQVEPLVLWLTFRR